MKKTREYIAFISYRHCPLDIRVAKELRKRIEHYRVPKDLRRDGKKTLGLAFRDRDELPLSSNLTEDIYEALDQSQFLIVVCTPETPKSLWVEEEIRYFIKKHGRERVLTVLAAGTPEESIPEIITHIHDNDGKLLQRIEPLCAYLVDEDEERILKNLKKEFLRLAAAILGCHYDALVQRQKRYRAQQIMIGASIVAAVALLFVLMLANSNQQIHQKSEELAQQLLQTQINESKAMTLLSKEQLASGNRIGAIESALQALPHDNDGRPYYAPAEEALADALNVYRSSGLDYYVTVSQKGDVCRLALSEDGRDLITLDTMGCLRCYDTLSGIMRWESSVRGDGWESDPVYNSIMDYYNDSFFINCLEVVEEAKLVLYSDEMYTHAISLETGELIHSAAFCTQRLDSGNSAYNTVALSADEKYFVQYSKPYGKDVGLAKETQPAEETQPDDDNDAISPIDLLKGLGRVSQTPKTSTFQLPEKTHQLEVYDTETFQLIYQHTCDWPEDWEASAPAFSLDGSRLAIAFSGTYLELLVLDTRTWEVVYQQTIEPAEKEYADNVYLTWLPGNELLLSYEQRITTQMGSYKYYDTYTFFEKFSNDGKIVSAQSFGIPETDGPSIELTHFVTDSYVYYNRGNSYVYSVNRSTLREGLGWTIDLAGTYLCGDGSLMLIEKDGRIGHTVTASKIRGDFYQPDEQIRIAAGTAVDEEVLCLVPDRAPYTVVIMRRPHLQGSVTVASPPMEEYGSISGYVTNLDLLVSTDGKELLAIDRVDTITMDTIAVTVYDAGTLEITDWFKIKGVDYDGLYLDDFSGFSADGTKLFFDGLVYDRRTGTLTEQENAEEICGKYIDLTEYPPFYTQSAGAPLISAYEGKGELHLWTDGADVSSVPVPYELETYCSDSNYSRVTSVGHSGLYVLPLFETDEDTRTKAYGIYSVSDGQWKLLENSVDRAGFPSFAIGAATKQVAFADMDRTLRVYDYEQDAVVHQWPLDLNTKDINDMQYIAQDRYLLIMTGAFQVHLIDMEDGTELGRYQCGAAMIPFLCGDYLYLKNTGESFRIALRSGEVVARFSELLCVLTRDGRETVICAADNQLIAIPVYTWEELAEMGREVVNRLKTGLATDGL